MEPYFISILIVNGCAVLINFSNFIGEQEAE